MVERLDADIGLTEVPRNGGEAYNMIIASLSADIEEKTAILQEMSNEGVKQEFIRQWHPGIKNVKIHIQ